MALLTLSIVGVSSVFTREIKKMFFLCFFINFDAFLSFNTFKSDVSFSLSNKCSVVLDHIQYLVQLVLECSSLTKCVSAPLTVGITYTLGPSSYIQLKTSHILIPIRGSNEFNGL